MKIIITRPAPDGETLAAMLSAYDVAHCLSPVMLIERTGAQVRHKGVGALAFTSANGIRIYCHDPEKDFTLPAFAVGQETAKACREAGFETVFEADGEVESLAVLIANEKYAGSFRGMIAHIAGKDRAGDLSELLNVRQIEATRFVLYHARAVERLAEEARLSLANDDQVGVVFFSARTVSLFVGQLARENFGITRLNITAFCLSENVVQAVETAGMARAILATARSTAAMAHIISTTVTKR